VISAATGFAMIAGGHQELADLSTLFVAVIAVMLLILFSQMLIDDEGQLLLTDHFLLLAMSILHLGVMSFIFPKALLWF